MGTHLAVVAEITGNSYILLGVMILMVFGVSYGLFTRQGSGINKHPQPQSGDPVLGDETKETDEDDEAADQRAGVGQTEGHTMDQHGVQ